MLATVVLPFFLRLVTTVCTSGFAPYESYFNWRYFDLETIQCTCVLPHQCAKGNADFETNGLLDPRTQTSQKICPPFQICCYESDILIGQLTKCGARHSSAHSDRIISLQQTTAHFADWPWHVAILEFVKNQTLFVCSGVLIDSKHVLTVAHCLAGRRHRKLYARLGEWNTQSTDEPLPHRDMFVARVTTHPNFDRVNLWNDMAVLTLKEVTTFEKNIQPICLPRRIIVQTFDCVITGWGKSAFDNGSYSATLKEASMRIVEFEKCQAQLRQTRLGRRFRLHPSFICATGMIQSDSCKGDGGGPLVCKGLDGLFYLTGLVSWGVNCAINGVPGVYVNVARLVPWIEGIVEMNE